jgi:phospholipid/cholesterol/gamma-HCH transport system permease protein
MLRELGPVLLAFMVAGRTSFGDSGRDRQHESDGTNRRSCLDGDPSDRVFGFTADHRRSHFYAAAHGYFNVAGIYSGYVVGVSLLDVSFGTYFGAMERSVVFHDVFGGLLNSVSFG